MSAIDTPRKRRVPIVTVITAATLATCVVAATAGPASAASLPQAQSVGNFVDATLGGNLLDPVVKLAYAKAKAPGKTSAQNPLDATALNAINLPLTGDLQLPQLLGVKLGAVNQVAKANTNGASYGASGAVQNSGGASVGGNNSAYPANATINLTAQGITGNTGGITLPGAGGLDALGGITATIGGVSGLVSTPKGYGKKASTKYQIANVDLTIGSPALGNVLSTITNPLTSLTGTLTGAIPTGSVLPASCKLSSATALSKPIELEKPKGSTKGAIEIDPSTGSITVHLNQLLKVLKLNLNNLPPNTDLIGFLLSYLADPNGLTKGLEGIIDGLTGELQQDFTDCASALGPIAGLLTGILGTGGVLANGQTMLEGVINGLVGQLNTATGASNPLAPLATGLQQLIDIGVNVQPHGPKGPKGLAYVDPLKATAKQGTPVVKGQTVERAIEVNVAGAAGSSLPALPGTGSLSGLGSLPSFGSLPGLPSLPGTNSLNETSLTSNVKAAAPAAAGNTGILSLALGNAAAGPSTAPTTVAPPTKSTTPAPNPTGSTPGTNVPTGVPAGQGTGGGTPELPLVLVLLTLALAAGGVATYRFRGGSASH